MNVTEIRAKYPQYGDLSDEQLGKALHSKFYSDMPYEEFAAKAGITKKVDVAAPTTPQRGRAALGGVNLGIAGLLGLPVDTAENIVNLGIAGVGSAATMAGRPDLAPNLLRGTPGGSESISALMNRGGIGTTNPSPNDPTSRMLHTGGRIAGGSLVPGSGVKSTMAAATGGALAGEIGGDEWIGVGAMAPGAGRQVASDVKARISARAAPVVETFKQAGATPSVGQALENAFLHGLENLAAKFPGGSGIMKQFIEAQQKGMGNLARTGVPAEAAGRAIEKGITGDTGFLSRTKAQWKQLDDAVAAKIPRDAEVAPVNTAKALAEMTASPKDAKATGKILTNPRVQEIYDSFKRDMAPPEVPLPGTEVPQLLKTLDKTVVDQPVAKAFGLSKTIESAATELHPHGFGQPSPPVSFPQTNVSGKTTMPYQTLRELRSKVGAMLDNELVSGIPSGEMKKLYGALSKDLEMAANQSGAGREFARQNQFYRARMERIESVLDRVIGKGKQPEDIFKAVMPTDPDQANKLRSVLRSLNTSERKVVSEAVANRLGRAKPGEQNVEGDVFSSETFLTNWNRLSLGAKAQLFPDPPLRENIDKIAKAAGHIREGKGIYSNPSGTAGSFAAYAVYMGPIAALGGSVAGFPGALAASATSAGTAFIGAKMMTSPKVVEWLAKPVNPSNKNAMAAHLSRLAVIYNQVDDDTKAELAKFVGQQ